MKRTLFRISSFGLQRQRGMARIGLVGAIAVALASGAIAIHQQSHASSVRATSKLPTAAMPITGGCGCDVKPTADLSKSKTYWTPRVSSYSAAELATMPTVLLLEAGKKLPLRLNPAAKGFGPQATWRARFGAIDSQGNYTAPPYMPAFGEDTITYEDLTARLTKTVRITVRILPNPAIPGSKDTPYIHSSAISKVFMSRSNQINTSNIVLGPGQSSPAPEFLKEIAVVALGETPSPPISVSQSREITAQNLGGKSVYFLPAQQQGNGITQDVYVAQSEVDDHLKLALELPSFSDNKNFNPDPRAKKEGHCKEGHQIGRMEGHPDTTVERLATVDKGEITINTSAEVGFKEIFKAKLGADGKVHGEVYPLSYKKITHKVIYQCKHGKYVKVATLTCTQLAVGETSEPDWLSGALDHAPPNGGPGPYTAPVCSQ